MLTSVNYFIIKIFFANSCTKGTNLIKFGLAPPTK